MKINILRKVRNRFLHIEQMILMATDFSNSVINILVQKAERKITKDKFRYHLK